MNQEDDDANRSHTAAPLEYFAANDPRRAEARGLNFWSLMLVLSWAPYVCGVVNASTVMASYSPRIISTHTNGALLFLGAGLALSVACLVAFVRQRHFWGIVASTVVVTAQTTIATCIGIAAT